MQWEAQKMALGAGKGMVSFLLIFPGCPQQVWELLWSRQSSQGQSWLMKCEQKWPVLLLGRNF